tara:strand:- start:404 stop:565 length:162 start_codon:yes stop_codon:yes gene_type:complete
VEAAGQALGWRSEQLFGFLIQAGLTRTKKTPSQKLGACNLHASPNNSGGAKPA